MKIMLRTNFIFLIIISLFASPLKGQDSVPDAYSKYLQGDGLNQENQPVTNTFENLILINTHSVENLSQNTLEFIIQHRFGKLSKNLSDLYGIYAPSNIRIGLNYGITDWFMAGLGTTKNGSFQDLKWKFKILRQTKKNEMPITLSYSGNIALVAGPKENFQELAHRVSYFHQLAIARKFGYYFSLQVTPSFMHFNLVDSSKDYVHDNFGVTVSGKVKISPQTSVIFEYTQGRLLSMPEDEEYQTKPGLGLGVEIATTSHSFQIFVSSYDGILPQDDIVYNLNDFTKAELVLGFNITRSWNF